MNSNANASPALVFIGIDWADREHAAAFNQQGDEACRHETLAQDPEAIARWVASLHQRFPDHRFLIALEQSRGALIAGLASFPELELYPINPKQLASYRDAVHPSGGKNDPRDAALLVTFLEHHHDQLRPWQPETAHTREIAELTELRRKLVEERKLAVLQLKSSLKQYFPLALKLCKRELHNEIVLAILRRWSSLEQLQRAHPKTLRTFLKEHGLANADQQTKMINTVRSAVPLTKDQSLIGPRSKYVEVLVRQIHDLNKAIEEFDQHLQDLVVARHPDQALFRSLPGAGDALVPRLIAAFGSDRDRYQTATQAQCYSGIAPITISRHRDTNANLRTQLLRIIRRAGLKPWPKLFQNLRSTRETALA